MQTDSSTEAATIQELVSNRAELFVKQIKEWIEIAIDWEVSNRYGVYDSNERQLGWIVERGGGIWDKLKRAFLRSHRGFVVDCVLTSGAVLLHLKRDFFWFFSDLDVVLPGGKRMGSIHRRFGIISKKYDLRDEFGKTFARVKSPIWRLWTFPIYDPMGEKRAEISKRWGGVIKEAFTDADTFRVYFGTHLWTEAQRVVIFAAAISIDFDFFENNQQSRGVANHLPIPGWGRTRD